MRKANLANRFGLVASFFVSLFPTTSAWAQKTSGTATVQGPQQVVVTNTAAQPIPIVGLVKVTEPVKERTRLNYFLNFPNGSYGVAQPSTYSVPAGKRLFIQYLSANCVLDQNEQLFLQMNSGDGFVTDVFLPMTTQYFPAYGPYRAIGASPVETFFDAGVDVQLNASRSVTTGSVGCNVSVLGYLIPMPQ